jgi:cytochrome c oxidase cbb3-type subunit III
MRVFILAFTAACSLSLIAGCTQAPGYPKQSEEVLRPQDQLDFHTLYRQNCAGCHGTNGENGPSIDLANPEYQALVDDDVLETWISGGLPGSGMPAFGVSDGGMLTDQQITALIAGMRKEWRKPGVFGAQTPPDYSLETTGDAARGHQVYGTACLSCHQQTKQQITDPNYLALVPDQALHSMIIAGRPDIGHPDWRNDIPGKPLSTQDVTDIVTYLSSLRGASSDQSQSQLQKQPQAAK